MVSTKINRSFPEARIYFLSEITGPNYPVKHLIEQARNKGYITKGKPGRGGGVVTSQDMAILLLGTLAGDTPHTATDAMMKLSDLSPNTSEIETSDFSVSGLDNEWWNKQYVDVISHLIDAWRQNFHLGFDDMTFSVQRSAIFYGSIIWNNIPYERDLIINYYPRHETKLTPVEDQRTIKASFNGITLRDIADWLEGREGH